MVEFFVSNNFKLNYSPIIQYILSVEYVFLLLENEWRYFLLSVCLRFSVYCIRTVFGQYRARFDTLLMVCVSSNANTNIITWFSQSFEFFISRCWFYSAGVSSASWDSTSKSSDDVSFASDRNLRQCCNELTVWNFYAAIHARESGSNKQMASKSCALSLIRQLFHLGVIEAYNSKPTKKQATGAKITYDVAVNPQIIDEITNSLKNYDITPQQIVRFDISYLSDLRFDFN